jgi:hypothetical protein
LYTFGANGGFWQIVFSSIKLSTIILAGTNAAFPVGGASAAIATAFAQCPLAKDEQKAGGNR